MIIDLVKAERSTVDKTAKIKGVISTEDVDLQGEIVKQKGLDFTHFEKNGVFNYEHKSGASNVLGYPTKVNRKRGQTEIEGVLLLDQPKAMEIITLAEAMEKAGRNRRIGFSVEGQVVDRDPYNPHIVTKAKVLNCAITTSPVNPKTSMTLIKALIKSVGYQTPSDVDGALSALIPQQLDTNLSVADSDSLRSSSFARIMTALTSIFPLADSVKISELAQRIIKEIAQ